MIPLLMMEFVALYRQYKQHVYALEATNWSYTKQVARVKHHIEHRAYTINIKWVLPKNNNMNLL